MRELSLNILDIAENSVAAKAALIEITITAIGNLLTIEITDNGKGMSPEFLKRVTDPFTTTRTTRKVGMGLPLFKQAAEDAGGRFHIESALGKGTTVKAEFQIDHIDRMPLGDVSETMISLIMTSPETDFVLIYSVEGRETVFDTREVRTALEGFSLSDPAVMTYIKEYLRDNISEVNGGISL